MSNSLVLQDQVTTVGAWLQAVQALDENGRQAYNLIYSITEPGRLTPNDRKVIEIFDRFALDTGLHATDTVANTIFPLDTFRNKRSPEFYKYYLDYVYPKVKKDWGTYFERMIRRRNDDGSTMLKEGVPLNPLARLVDKAGRRVAGLGKTTTHYELSLDEPVLDVGTFEPHHDGAYQIGGPCLSHISFKVDAAGAVRLTAFYRSHWYIARALGNLIGLARLQAFVASEAKATVGPLTLIAAEAVLDLSGKGRTAAVTRNALDACKAAWLTN